VEERAVEEENVARRRGSGSQSSAIRSQRCTWIMRGASRSYTTMQWPFENRCSRSRRQEAPFAFAGGFNGSRKVVISLSGVALAGEWELRAMFQPEGGVTLGSSDEARRFHTISVRGCLKMSSPTDGDRYAPVVAHRGSLLEAL
jgi:hypothetical protein